MNIIKKVLAVFMSVVMAVFGIAGIVGNVSDDYTEGKYKNVILMIGDGMGFNTLQATEEITGAALTMKTMPVQLKSDIDSFVIPYTDSAAGGTALATGMRVWINSVAVFPFNPVINSAFNTPLSLGELVKAIGKATGVVTTDQTSGATPSAFSAHALARNMEEEISADQLKNGFDLIWGAESESINAENTKANGWTYVTNEDELMALEEGSRSFAQFNFDDLKYTTNKYNTPTIEEMTNKAIDLLSADEDGFFLMVEGACIDKHAHNNEMENVNLATLEFDKAVKAALDFAEEDGETLVVVTADHSTGGIVYDEKAGEWTFSHGTHDFWDVPVFVSAEDAGFVSDIEIKNRQIPVQIARVMGYGEESFPASSLSLEK